MDCTFTVPVTIAKFSHTILSAIVATFLSVAPDDVGISARWAPGDTFDDIPETVLVSVPDGTGKTCAQIGAHIASNYDPGESDDEERTRKTKEYWNTRIQSLPVIIDILDRLTALEGQ